MLGDEVLGTIFVEWTERENKGDVFPTLQLSSFIAIITFTALQEFKFHILQQYKLFSWMTSDWFRQMEGRTTRVFSWIMRWQMWSTIRAPDRDCQDLGLHVVICLTFQACRILTRNVCWNRLIQLLVFESNVIIPWSISLDKVDAREKLSTMILSVTYQTVSKSTH